MPAITVPGKGTAVLVIGGGPVGLALAIELKHLLVRQMLGRMREDQFAQPAPIRLRPMAIGRVQAVAEQEAQEMLARLTQVAHRLRSQSHQIPHRLVRFVWDPHRRQLAGP